MGGLPGDVGEVPVTYEKQRKSWRMSCDVGKATEEFRMSRASFSNPYIVSSRSQLILQSFPPFTYVTAYSWTLLLLHLRHSPFSNPSVASPTSQLILQPFRCFTYVTTHSITPPSLHHRYRHFTYVTWRAVHAQQDEYPSHFLLQTGPETYTASLLLLGHY